MRRRGVVALLAAASVLASCRRSAPSNQAVDAAADAQATAPAPEDDKADVALDLLDPSPRCRVEHRGALIDLGTVEAAWATPGHPDVGTDFPMFERDGANWGRVLDRSQTFTIAFEQSGAALVALRGRAKGAKKVVASVDGKTVGTLVLSATEDKVVTASNPSLTLAPGMHTLTLRWIGAVKKEEALAEIDWIRVGTVDEDPSAYAAPTRVDVVNQVAIGGTPRRAYTLRAPAVIRCVAWVPQGAKLTADVGAIGDGTGEVELRERESGSSVPTVLARVTATSKSWSGVSAPLHTGDGGGHVAVLEIAVLSAPKQGRIAVAEPRIVDPAPKSLPTTLTRPDPPLRVVVIVLAGLGTAGLELPSLKKLAREGVVYRAHRAPSSLAAASVASLVTGLPIPVHALEDPGARLSPLTPTFGKLLVPFGVESAMFTEAPTTGPAFGFAHDWAHYAARSPLDGPSAAFEELDKFLAPGGAKKTVIVAHARGAHPPWDLGPEALKTLGPEGYAGPVDPKHVVSIVTKARRGLFHLNEADRARLLAMQSIGLAAQDAKLDALIESMRAAGTLDGAMLIVTSDAPYPIPAATAKEQPTAAGSTSASLQPPSPPPPPHEVELPADDPLAIPLVIRFPHGFGAGRVVTAMTDPTDVAVTVVAGFGASTSDLAGRDLALLAVDDARARDAARLLDDGHGYQLAWGDLRLVGAWGKAPTIREGTFAGDAKAKRPYEYLAAWGLAAHERERWLSARAKGPGREPATIDAATSAAMDTWERVK